MPEEIPARDRKTVIELVQQAQLVDAFGRLPKKQFMDRPHDQARVAERIIAMRKTAGDLSERFRNEHGGVPWDDLEKLGVRRRISGGLQRRSRRRCSTSSSRSSKGCRRPDSSRESRRSRVRRRRDPGPPAKR